MKGRWEPELADAYEKDPAEEDLLERINRQLEPLDRELRTEGEAPHPMGFVVGVPRSGTTLLTQVLTSALDVGYVDHIAAAFWGAPVVGLRLSRKLLGAERPSSFSSEFGRTHGLQEPHEFGYFWSERLDYREPREKTAAEAAAIDWSALRADLANMSMAHGKPAVYKSFHVGWHMARVSELIPRSVFFWVRRPPLETALSLLGMRRQFLGSETRWASFKPQDHEAVRDADPATQVAWQVHSLERSLAREAAGVPEGRRLVLTYQDLCADPAGAVADAAATLEGAGERPAGAGDAPAPFGPSDPTARESADTVAAVREALARWYPDPATVGPWTELTDGGA